jgi:hypothetical protein
MYKSAYLYSLSLLLNHWQALCAGPGLIKSYFFYMIMSPDPAHEGHGISILTQPFMVSVGGNWNVDLPGSLGATKDITSRYGSITVSSAP